MRRKKMERKKMKRRENKVKSIISLLLFGLIKKMRGKKM